MLIANYNFAQTGDVLMVVLRQDSIAQVSEKKDNVVRIYDEKTGETLGYNFFQASKRVSDLNGVSGQVKLTQKQVNDLNDLLNEAGFAPELAVDDKPRFVVGYVEEMVSHPDSDHLHILKVLVNDGEHLQIVCGAPNIAEKQTVVVARVGAMMPSGAIIWPGKLRGKDSFGMVCSARELGLPNAPKKRGILELPAAEYEVGQAFDFKQAAGLFSAK